MGMIWVGYRREEAAARALLEDPEKLDAPLQADDTSIDLDKTWHALHWLLNTSDGTPHEALSDAILGGEGIGVDRGYGPGTLLSAERVRAVAHALAQSHPNSLRARMDPVAMEAAEVYPMIWDEDDVFDSYLAPADDRLRDFYSAAAKANEAVIQTMC